VGIRQGNGVGPPIWAAISSLLFEIMQTNGFVASFICAISKEHWAMAGFAFIDNMDLTVSDAKQKSWKIATILTIMA